MIKAFRILQILLAMWFFAGIVSAQTVTPPPPSPVSAKATPQDKLVCCCWSCNPDGSGGCCTYLGCGYVACNKATPGPVAAKTGPCAQSASRVLLRWDVDKSLLDSLEHPSDLTQGAKKPELLKTELKTP